LLMELSALCRVEVEEGLALVALIGNNLSKACGVGKEVFGVLDPVTLASLAQAVAMSPFHLHRLFKACTGMTPKGWQQAWRARRL
ncbi:AraC family transcriptional regulator, partial [Salmonella enterica subsp. enterica serovar Anatum]|nr:AraC family transcriptional regulator [Salmonella enterica subsp. enterica serovar Anatum]